VPDWFRRYQRLLSDCRLCSGTIVLQIDLVPTLSTFMGIPIPYSSIGSIMPELLFSTELSLLENTNQIRRYLESYNSLSALPAEEYARIDSQLATLARALEQSSQAVNSEVPLVALYMNTMEIVQQFCRCIRLVAEFVCQRFH
jgi:hypothetical protein